MTFVLIITGYALYWLVDANLISQFDEALADEAYLLASTTEYDNGRFEVDFSELDMRDYSAYAKSAFLQLKDSSGKIIYLLFCRNKLTYRK